MCLGWTHSNRLDCFDKVFKNSDERPFGHATICRSSQVRGSPIPGATRFAAFQMRRLNAVSPNSIPSAKTKGDDRRRRVISSSRLVKRRRIFDGGSPSKSDHSHTNE